jgi:hypothetical protein
VLRLLAEDIMRKALMVFLVSALLVASEQPGHAQTASAEEVKTVLSGRLSRLSSYLDNQAKILQLNESSISGARHGGRNQGRHANSLSNLDGRRGPGATKQCSDR